jgi:hypothetical protein
MPNCLRCNAELTVLHPWNSEGDALTCTTPFCEFENRPQGWLPNPLNKAFFVNYNESFHGHGTTGKRSYILHIQPGITVSEKPEINKKPKYSFGRLREED